MGEETRLAEIKASRRREKQSLKRRQRAETLVKAKESIESLAGHAKNVVGTAIDKVTRDVDEKEQIIVHDSLTIGRVAEFADWLVPEPEVSRRHAKVHWRDGSLYLIDNSRSGTFINRTRVPRRKKVILNDGDIVKIGTTEFSVNGQTLKVFSSTEHAHIVCKGLSKDVGSKKECTEKRILNSVNLHIEPNNFIVLLGPSGSGKSTLLNAMSCRSLATGGEVLLNQEDLYLNFNRLKTRIATVPQKDLLHSSLTLKSALTYTSKLRLNADFTEPELEDRVAQVINEVEMADHANATISTYSGGQLKRASLANELLSKPSLLFIDEATSGLDEHSDREIMAMLRQLADTGKTIVCVTHNLGNVPRYVHKLVVMANGGYVAFFGSPEETLAYFEINDLSDLYLRLKEKPGIEWAAEYKNTLHYQNDSNEESARTSSYQIKRDSTSPLQKLKVIREHFITCFFRTAELQQKDKKSIGVAIAQPAFVFLLICIVFGDISENPGVANQNQIASGLSILFLVGISAFWFGCSNSAKEIVKERELFEREKNAGLSPLGYLASKVVFLFALTMAQSWSLFVLVISTSGLEGNVAEYGVSISLTCLCGVALGLAISALSTNTDVAATAVPLAIIPQVILAGMIKKLDGFSELVAWLVAPSYWCFGSMSSVWNSLWDEKYNTEGMFSQQHYFLSISILFVFTVAFFMICAFNLMEVRLAELSKRFGEKSITLSNRSLSLTHNEEY